MIENRLKHILVDKDMSIRQLALNMGVAYSILNDFANLKRQSVQFDVLDAICRELTVTPGDILVYRPDKR